MESLLSLAVQCVSFSKVRLNTTPQSQRAPRQPIEVRDFKNLRTDLLKLAILLVAMAGGGRKVSHVN